MRAHLVQLDIAWENKAENHRRVGGLVARADPGPGDLVILPEMFDTGFSFNISATNDADGATLGFLQDLAARTRTFVHGARTTLSPDGRGRNVATVIDPSGAIITEYQKTHLFPLGAGTTEAACFEPGSSVRTYSWPDGGAPSGPRSGALVVCPTICYDLRFPELYRRGLRVGAEVFVVASSWPQAREGHRRALSIARAIENQAYVLSVNRCGSEPAVPAGPGNAYAGGSLAISPKGEIVGELGAAEGVLSVEIDPREVRRWREIFPAWREGAAMKEAQM